MKLSVLLLSAAISLPAFAQTVGIEGGVVVSSYKAAGNPDAPRSNIATSQKPGLALGAHADFTLAKNWYLRSGLLMVVKGGVEKGLYTDPGYNGPYSESKNFVAFDFPFNLLYKTGPAGSQRWVFGAGVVPGLLIETGLNKADLGASLLVGYETPGGLHGNLMYHHGLANVATQSFDYSSLRNRSLAVTLGYHFRHKTAAEIERVRVFEQSPATVQRGTKAVYAELGSPAGFLTLNYDARLTRSHKGLGFRVGAGIIFDPYGLGFTVPATLNYLAGNKTHFFEIAAGTSFFSFKERNQDGWFNFREQNFIVPFVWAGYRYQPLYKKFFFRAGLGRPIGVELPVVFQVPSLSFGYSIR